MKKDIKAYFSIPGLFEKFHIMKQVVSMYENYPYIFNDYIVISSFYGSNGGVANGGRNSCEYHNEKEVSKFCQDHNICPIIIMSNLFYDKPDEFANKIIESFGNKNTMFCVASPNIEKWLEERFIRRGQFILSTTVCLDFKELIKKTNNYKKIVLPESMINDWKLLSKFPEQTRNKLEVIVNTACPLYCENRKSHYEWMSNVNLGKSDGIFKCIHKDYCGKGALYELINAPQFVNKDMIISYLNLGINHFKIQGRTNDDNDFIETLSYFLVKQEYQLMFREKCREK